MDNKYCERTIKYKYIYIEDKSGYYQMYDAIQTEDGNTWFVLKRNKDILKCGYYCSPDGFEINSVYIGGNTSIKPWIKYNFKKWVKRILNY